MSSDVKDSKVFKKMQAFQHKGEVREMFLKTGCSIF